jgi:hypothetical protein
VSLSPPLRVIQHATAGLLRSQCTREQAIRDAFSPELRREYGYTIDDIAEAAGLSRQRIYQLAAENADEALTEE